MCFSCPQSGTRRARSESAVGFAPIHCSPPKVFIREYAILKGIMLLKAYADLKNAPDYFDIAGSDDQRLVDGI